MACGCAHTTSFSFVARPPHADGVSRELRARYIHASLAGEAADGAAVPLRSCLSEAGESIATSVGLVGGRSMRWWTALVDETQQTPRERSTRTIETVTGTVMPVMHASTTIMIDVELTG